MTDEDQDTADGIAQMPTEDCALPSCETCAPRTCGRQATHRGGRRPHDGHPLSLILALGCITIQAHHAPLM